jgi:hypothetical protein
MAAKKKKAKPAARKSKKKSARRAKPSVHFKAPRAAATPAELKELDSEWRSFIKKSVSDVPLTEVWKAPKGVASAKRTIGKAAKKKAVRKRPKKKAVRKTAKKKAVSRKK